METPRWTTQASQIIVPIRRRDVIVNRLDGEAAVTDPITGDVYQLNQTAWVVWMQCNGKRSTLEMACRLIRQYEVNFETALEDVEQLVAFFAKSRLLEFTGSVFKGEIRNARPA